MGCICTCMQTAVAHADGRVRVRVRVRVRAQACTCVQALASEEQLSVASHDLQMLQIELHRIKERFGASERVAASYHAKLLDAEADRQQLRDVHAKEMYELASQVQTCMCVVGRCMYRCMHSLAIQAYDNTTIERSVSVSVYVCL